MAVAMGADGALPKRVKIASWGVNTVRTGKPDETRTFVVNETTASVLQGNQTQRGFDRVALDYEHQTAASHPNYTPPPHEVAGHGVIEVVPGEGLFISGLSYTPSGKKNAPNYPDVSGVFWTNAKGEVIFVTSVALCQQGAIEGAEFVEAEMIAASVASVIAASMTDGNAPSDLERLNSAVRDFLGFAEDALPADLAQAVEALTRQRRREADARSETTNQPGKKSGQTQTEQPDKTKTTAMENEELKALTASVKQLTEQNKTIIDRLATDDHNRAVEAVITANVALGKVIPATIKTKDDQGRYKLSAADAKEILDVIPATVPTQSVTTAKATADGDAAAIETEIAASMGISSEAWKKGGIKRAHEPAQAGVNIA